MTKPAIMSPALLLVFVGEQENGQGSSTIASAELALQCREHSGVYVYTCSLGKYCWPKMPSLRAGPSLRCPLLERAPPFPSCHLGYLDNYS